MIILALRNFVRHARRNFLLVTALAVGVAGAIFADAYIAGLQQSMLEETSENLPGMAQIMAEGYLEEPGLEHAFVLRREALEQLVGSHPVTPRLTVQAIVQSERTTRGVQLVGVDPALELTHTFVRNIVVDGALPASRSDDGVVIGAELAARLKTRVGQRVVLMLRDADDELHERGIRIVGVYSGPNRGVESHVVLMGLETLQQFVGSADLLTDVAVFDDNYASLAAQLPAGLELRSWDDIQPMVAALRELMGGVSWLLRFVIFVALAFGIVNTLMASVFERTREFGLLLAMGMPPRHIFTQVTVEVIIIVACAMAAGLVLGAGGLAFVGDSVTMSAFQDLGVPGISSAVSLQFRPAQFASLTVFVLALAVLASLYPVRRAMRLDPVVAMNRV